MKKTLSVILAVITIALCLCSCGKAELTYGTYSAEYNEETGLQPYLRLISTGKASFGYNGAHERTFRATYTYDEDANTVTVNILGYGGVLVFEIKKDKLVFVAEGSSDIKEFNGVPGITDGQELFVESTYAS